MSHRPGTRIYPADTCCTQTDLFQIFVLQKLSWQTQEFDPTAEAPEKDELQGVTSLDVLGYPWCYERIGVAKRVPNTHFVYFSLLFQCI